MRENFLNAERNFLNPDRVDYSAYRRYQFLKNAHKETESEREEKKNEQKK